MTLAASTGYISGTPTTAGTYSFTAQVTDSQAPSVATTKAFTLTVVRPLTITTTTLTNATVGTATTKALAATGGIKPYNWTLAAGSLPPGMTLAASTGYISGTPTTAGTYSFTAQVTDSQAPSVTATKAFTLTVVIGPLTITTTTLTNATVGTATTKALAATGGIKPYNWTLAAGSLPPGMTLAASTGYISGTPTTAGTYSFTAQVTDSQAPSVTATKAFTLTVVIGPLTITTTTLTNATVGTATTKALAATGGIKPYIWTLAAGSLPPGMTLAASTGYISGTPTTAGTYSFTAQVTDSQAPSVTATKAFTLTVVIGPLTITTTTLTNATVGTATTKLAATGGIKPYNWTLAAGSLPPGMTLAASTGYISGTPTTAGTYSFTAQVTDSQAPSVTATKAFTLTVVIDL